MLIINNTLHANKITDIKGGDELIAKSIKPKISKLF